jgi:signal transduction histidine kinase
MTVAHLALPAPRNDSMQEEFLHVVDHELQAARTVIEARAEGAGVVVAWSSVDATLVVDGPRIAQALAIVLDNAVRASAAGAAVLLTVELQDPTLIVKIEDVGRGIDPDRLEKIFEPFTLAEPTLTREQEGLGLGLARARAIIEAHGGSVHVASRLERGTTLTLGIPLRPAVASGSGG